MQMLSLTAEQINALPPNERQAIQQLVSSRRTERYESALISFFFQKSQFMALGSIS